jgi:hypothetical protein
VVKNCWAMAAFALDGGKTFERYCIPGRWKHNWKSKAIRSTRCRCVQFFFSSLSLSLSLSLYLSISRLISCSFLTRLHKVAAPSSLFSFSCCNYYMPSALSPCRKHVNFFYLQFLPMIFPVSRNDYFYTTFEIHLHTHKRLHSFLWHFSQYW